MPQQARGDTVEGAQPHAVGAVALAAEQFLDALLEFARGLVGEGHGQDPARVSALGNKVGQPVGDHARLARAGASDDQQRLRRKKHGLDLGWVQLVAEHLLREAASWCARGCREEICRFHAPVIQTVVARGDAKRARKTLRPRRFPRALCENASPDADRMNRTWRSATRNPRTMGIPGCPAR